MIAECLENQFTPQGLCEETMNVGWRFVFKLCLKLWTTVPLKE
jgi:hypothetical protein